MPNDIVILGAGGHAKVIADIVLSSGDRLLGFLDDHQTDIVLGYPVLGTIKDVDKFRPIAKFIIGIGSNYVRKELSEKCQLSWHSALHPNAVIGRDVIIGEGTVVMAGAIINPSSSIGKHCIINTGAIIEHDNRIGDFVHISPNATLCGTVQIGELSHVGASATVRNNIDICEECIIGVGAAVIKNIEEAGTYVGVPVRKQVL